MTDDPTSSAPDSTAVRVALWRALHIELDAPPHVIDDVIGVRLASPEPGWRDRGDMNPEGTRPFRASIVGRARFLDDLVLGSALPQYVILGAGLDTFAQRHPDVDVRVFEVDQPGTSEWKRRRLADENLPLPVLVPVDFETGESWRDALQHNGFDMASPAVVSSTGVSMYLTRAATDTTLRQVATLAKGSVFVMTFMLPVELVDAADQPVQTAVEQAAASSGTPFISHYAPDDMLAMCRDTGFSSVQHVSPDDITRRYFADRADGLRPPSAEHLVVARV